MPIQTSFAERAAFFTLKMAPSPILDMAGLFAFQAISVAVRQGVFTALAAGPLTPEQLAEKLRCQERGMQMLLEALAAIGDVAQANGRYQNTPLTEKWVLPNDAFNNAVLLAMIAILLFALAAATAHKFGLWPVWRLWGCWLAHCSGMIGRPFSTISCSSCWLSV